MTGYAGGVRFTGFVAPSDTTDTYAVTDSRFNLGGAHEVADHTERDAITADRRREGMTCYTANDQTTWTLVGGITNSNWQTATALPVDIITTFAWGDASPYPIYTFVQDVTISEVIMTFDIAFDGASPLVIIGDIGQADRLMSANQNDPKDLSSFSTTPMYAYTSGESVTITIVPGAGASQGSGRVKLIF